MEALAFEPQSPDAFEFVELVARAYAGLMQSASADPETGLGGKLFYAGKLDDEGRALVVAANIAGAASLVATADRAAQKQAIRDGVADFLVNSLDETLRILKNQLHKRETVAVCLGLAPEAIEPEMQERGVVPDLLRRDVPIAPFHDALLFQKGECDETDRKSIPALVVWSVDSARHKDLALLDEIALASLEQDEWAARRWLRFAPRYLGRLAHGLHLLSLHREFAARFFEQVGQRVDRGEIPVAFEICAYFSGIQDSFPFDPDKTSSSD
jgi:urocanate hydratase